MSVFGRALPRAVWASTVAATRPNRLLHVAKTAAAASAAWYLGHLLPGDPGEYPYYAPLGTLIAMVPSVASSVRASVETLAGVLIGVLLAWVLLGFGMSGWLAVPVAVGIGTLLAGFPRLGAGRDYIPIAALFVFVVGGSDVDGFTIGYVSQMALGAAIGVAVTLIIPPPVATNEAQTALTGLRRDVGSSMRLFADSIDPDQDDDNPSTWADLLADIDRRASVAGRSVTDMHRSKRGNVRAYRRHTRLSGADEILLSLQRIIRQLNEFSELSFELDARQDQGKGTDSGGEGDLSDGHGDRRDDAGAEVYRAIARTCRGAAGLVELWDEGDAAGLDEAVAAAREELARVGPLAEEWRPDSPPALEHAYVVTHILRRIIDEVARYGEADSGAETADAAA